MVRSLGDRLNAFFSKGSPPPEEETPRDSCQACGVSLVDAQLYLQYAVCPSCRFHYSITARERVGLLADPGSFRESQRSIVALGPPLATTRPKGGRSLSRSRERSGLTEATITGRCTIDGKPVVLIVLDLRYLGGTLGGVVGEKIALALDMAAKRKVPAVAVTTTGGAGSQEGVLSLMQTAKISFAINGLAQEGLPFISVLGNPATGQAYASFGSLGDVVLAEPKAVLGLAPTGATAGPQGEPIPSGAYAAESQLAHGMVDRVVDREHLRDLLSVLLELLSPRNIPTPNENDADGNAVAPVERVRHRLETPELEELWPSAWETVAISRYSQRPTSRDFMRRTLTDFVELHGDRLYGDDPALIAGVGYLGKQPVVAIGQERGHDATLTDRHEGRTGPEGFRKATRAMQLAAKLQLPVITFIDTPGPYYGRESEERGIGGAIAATMACMAQLPVPTVAAVIGQGGSEGAMALATADRVLMLENAAYVVTSPEQAASLLYGNLPKSRGAAAPLHLTARDCQELGIVDAVLEEPPDGAGRNPHETADRLRIALEGELATLIALPAKRMARERERKFRKVEDYSSHFRVALGREVSQLQGYVAQGVRLIRRRRRGRSLPNPQDDQGKQ